MERKLVIKIYLFIYIVEEGKKLAKKERARVQSKSLRKHKNKRCTKGGQCDAIYTQTNAVYICMRIMRE